MSKTLEITPQSQNWALKMFYMIIHDHFKEKQSIGICNICLKSAQKMHFTYQGVLNYCNLYFYNGNMPQYATWGQGMTKN